MPSPVWPGNYPSHVLPEIFSISYSRASNSSSVAVKAKTLPLEASSLDPFKTQHVIYWKKYELDMN